ncbi:type 11 methyltransferase [Nostoc carneum NIES-2107]|nr:type 11 methyltransferase [Nostoc carneum NIES-2107]
MNEAFLEPILRHLRLKRVISHIPKDSAVLDVGCGTAATFLKTISPQIKQGCGVDFKVKDFQSGNIQTKQLMLENHLPFKDESFDVVTMLAVLEHIEHEKEILKEIYRVLAPQGKLILTVPSVWSQPVLEFLAYRLKIVSEAEIRDHKRYYKRETLRKVLVNFTGFQEFHHQYFQFWMNNFCTVTKKS